jgi:nucleotide-binding universal stress UspA family protein
MAVAEASISLAEEFRSRLALLHVIENYTQLGRKPGPMEESMRRLEELVPASSALQYAPEFLLEFGSAPERILKVALEHETDMIVLGARSSAEVGTTHFPWSSAHYVIAQSRCPVLTIPKRYAVVRKSRLDRDRRPSPQLESLVRGETDCCFHKVHAEFIRERMVCPHILSNPLRPIRTSAGNWSMPPYVARVHSRAD